MNTPTRIQPLEPAQATGKAKQMLDAVKAKMGLTPNLLKTMALSPPVLGSYLAFSGAMGESTLSPKLREQINLAISQANECDYCLAGHTFFGKKAGLTDTEILAARRGVASVERDAAAMAFALEVSNNRGHVTDETFALARAAGFTDAQLLEIVATVILITFTNYVNHVADTEVDFPAAPALAS